MTRIINKKLMNLCDCCKSHFDKPCAWLSLGNEYCTEIMEIQQELNEYKFPNCKTKDIEVVRANLVDMMRKNKRLEQENERLKENNQVMQEEMARVCQVNERLKEWNEDLLHEGVELENTRKEAIEYIKKQKNKMYKSRNKIALFILIKLENILQNGVDVK